MQQCTIDNSIICFVTCDTSEYKIWLLEKLPSLFMTIHCLTEVTNSFHAVASEQRLAQFYLTNHNALRCCLEKYNPVNNGVVQIYKDMLPGCIILTNSAPKLYYYSYKAQCTSSFLLLNNVNSTK